MTNENAKFEYNYMTKSRSMNALTPMNLCAFCACMLSHAWGLEISSTYHRQCVHLCHCQLKYVTDNVLTEPSDRCKYSVCCTSGACMCKVLH